MASFSIITVVFNDVHNIGETIKSVLSQNHKQLEHIIIDGSSTDGTLEIIRRYPSIVLVSETDDGLYSAMNKGLKLASGDYVNFMNSGDRFYDRDVLGLVASSVTENNAPDLVYGNAVEVCNVRSKTWFKKARSFRSIIYGMPAHHQAMFYKLDKLCKENLNYSPRYSRAADYAMTAALIKTTKHIVKLDHTICFYDLGGLSQTTYLTDMSETMKIKREVLGMSAAAVGFISFFNKVANLVKFNFPKLYPILRYPINSLLLKSKDNDRIQK